MKTAEMNKARGVNLFLILQKQRKNLDLLF